MKIYMKTLLRNSFNIHPFQQNARRFLGHPLFILNSCTLKSNAGKQYRHNKINSK